VSGRAPLAGLLREAWPVPRENSSEDRIGSDQEAFLSYGCLMRIAVAYRAALLQQLQRQLAPRSMKAAFTMGNFGTKAFLC
jgi:hypothetical protein